MMGWQSIETAPKDGTLIALAEGSFLASGLWRDVYRAWMTPTDEGWQRHVINPTHWAMLDDILPPRTPRTKSETTPENEPRK